MAYTAPVAWVAGTVVTDVQLNAQLYNNMLWLGGTTGVITQSVYAASSTAESTTSNTGVTMTAPSANITTGGGDVLLFGGCSVANSVVSAQNNVYIVVDGVVNGPYALWSQPVAAGLVSVGVQLKVAAPSAAAHTYALGWATTTGTLSTSTQVNRWMLAVEIRR